MAGRRSLILGADRRDRAALRRGTAAAPVVPHDDRLPDPGGAAAAAGARRAARRRPALPEWLKTRYAWYIQIFNICNYTLAMLAAWASFARRPATCSARPTPVCVRARRARGRGVDGRRSTTSCSRRCCASRAATRCARRACSRSRASRPTSSSRRSASRSPRSGTVNPWLIPFAVAPLLLIHRSLAVPQLQEEARVDPKTGLFNARHFALALRRGARARRPLRAAAVARSWPTSTCCATSTTRTATSPATPSCRGSPRSSARSCATTTCRPASAARSSRSCCRRRRPSRRSRSPSGSAARSPRARSRSRPRASRSARRSRSASRRFPRDGADANELVHQADLAVYRAKLQGRNRVLDASTEPLLARRTSARRASSPCRRQGEHVAPLAAGRRRSIPERERRHRAPARAARCRASSRSRAGSRSSSALVGFARHRAPASLGFVYGSSTDWIGLVAIVALVGVGQALALEVDDGSISVSAVGCARRRRALRPARGASARDHDRRRRVERAALAVPPGALQRRRALARLARGRRRLHGRLRRRPRHASSTSSPAWPRARLLRRQHGPVSLAVAVEGHERWRRSSRSASPGWRPHYLVYGFIAGVICGRLRRPPGLWALAVFALPLLLMRKTQEAYLRHTQRSAQKLRAGRRDDPDAERLARAGEQAAPRALDRGDGVPLGDGRRARRLHGRPLAPRPAARAGDRPGARPLAGRARPARARGALPRHRQARRSRTRSCSSRRA